MFYYLDFIYIFYHCFNTYLLVVLFKRWFRSTCGAL